MCALDLVFTLGRGLRGGWPGAHLHTVLHDKYQQLPCHQVPPRAPLVSDGLWRAGIHNEHFQFSVDNLLNTIAWYLGAMEFGSLKVAALRKELDKRGLETGGKKAELVSRLEAHEKQVVNVGGDDEGGENDDVWDCICGSTRQPTAGFGSQCGGCQRWIHGECSGVLTESALPSWFLCAHCKVRSYNTRRG